MEDSRIVRRLRVEEHHRSRRGSRSLDAPLLHGAEQLLDVPFGARLRACDGPDHASQVHQGDRFRLGEGRARLAQQKRKGVEEEKTDEEVYVDEAEGEAEDAEGKGKSKGKKAQKPGKKAQKPVKGKAQKPGKGGK